MARNIQRSDSHGSLKQLQLLVNNRQDLLDQSIKESITSFTNDNIIWKSPLQDDDYAEYTDNDFLTRIGFDPDEINLHEFWPQRGANWDALATTDKGKIVLVEAKANIPEMVSPPSGAGEVSMTMIQNALNETKEYLNKNTVIDWAGKFYQYTNRIAHLYFLRVKKNKKAFLINIYFVGDQTVDGPKTVEEWKGAIQVMNFYLGLNSHKLKKYMADIFIDVTDLK